MQPAYLAWPGYYDRIRRSDHLVILDHVDVDLNSKTKFANRNRIRTAQGYTWLTVPLAATNSRRICDLEIAESKWQRKHWNSIYHSYKKTPWFTRYAEQLREFVYEKDHNHLTEVAEATNGLFMSAFGLTQPVSHSSEMNLVSTKADLILEICLKLKASTYLSGPFGREYLSKTEFDRASVQIFFHEYKTPVYEQTFPDFVPNLSAIDLLFNVGGDSLGYLEEGGSLRDT